MVVNLAIAVGVAIALMFVTSALLRIVGINGLGLFVVQTAVFGIVGYVLLSIGIIGFLGLGLYIASPAITMFAGLVFIYVQSKRALAGRMGDEVQWAAELYVEEDEDFIKAAKALPKKELKEIAIIAETKDGLRELTVERHKELLDRKS